MIIQNSVGININMPCNISIATATSVTLICTPPTGSTFNLTMSIDSTGYIAQYVTTATDFTQVGTYTIQLKVVFPVVSGYPNGRTLYTPELQLYCGAVT